MAALVVAAICLFSSGPLGADEGKDVKQNRQITLLAFGDSLTAGYGVRPVEALPSQLEALLLADGFSVRVVNAGVSGDTTSGGLARLPWTLEQPVDAAILELGANDGLMGMPVQAMEGNLVAMLGMFRERNIPVLLAGMRAIANYGEDYSRAFDEVFPRLAAQHDVLFYPFLLDGVVLDPKLNQADGIHPNADGVREIANRMYPMVRELVERAIRN